MTDFRALCAELVELDQAEPGDYANWRQSWNAAIARARAALAQPEPQGFTPDHVNLMCFAFEREPWATWLRRGGCLESAHCELSDLMLAVLARWGRPAIGPEPERPMPEVDDILRLAAIIRRVDGNHDKNAAALAEAILSHPDSRWQHAQPEPQGPTQAELRTFACKWWHSFGFVKNKATCTWVIDQIAPEHFVDFSRDLLARWGRPAIGPVSVSERLPGPEDCDAEGRCWLWNSYENMWDLINLEYRVRAEFPHSTHWLPHWALPVPGVEGADA